MFGLSNKMSVRWIGWLLASANFVSYIPHSNDHKSSINVTIWLAVWLDQKRKIVWGGVFFELHCNDIISSPPMKLQARVFGKSSCFPPSLCLFEWLSSVLQCQGRKDVVIEWMEHTLRRRGEEKQVKARGRRAHCRIQVCTLPGFQERDEGEVSTKRRLFPRKR